MKCICCDKELAGGLDTFGEVGYEMCWDCHSAFLELEKQYFNQWYGMAPHHHDMTLTGHWLGSTVFDPLPEPPNANGEYEIEPGLFFRPDPEVDGTAGMWRDERKDGSHAD